MGSNFDSVLTCSNRTCNLGKIISWLLHLVFFFELSSLKCGLWYLYNIAISQDCWQLPWYVFIKQFQVLEWNLQEKGKELFVFFSLSWPSCTCSDMHLREVFLLDAFISEALSLYKPRQGVLPSLDKVTHIEAITHFISLSSTLSHNRQSKRFDSRGVRKQNDGSPSEWWPRKPSAWCQFAVGLFPDSRAWLSLLNVIEGFVVLKNNNHRHSEMYET